MILFINILGLAITTSGIALLLSYLWDQGGEKEYSDYHYKTVINPDGWDVSGTEMLENSDEWRIVLQHCEGERYRAVISNKSIDSRLLVKELIISDDCIDQTIWKEYLIRDLKAEYKYETLELLKISN